MTKTKKKTKRKGGRSKTIPAVAEVPDESVLSIPGVETSRQARQRAAAEPSTPALSPWVNLVQFGLAWIVFVALVAIASKHSEESDMGPKMTQDESSSPVVVDGFRIPKDLMGPWTVYPNVLNITEETRRRFHPVVVFPKIWVDVEDDNEGDGDGKRRKRAKRREQISNYQILDLTTSSSSTQLATEEEREAKRQEKQQRRKLWRFKDDSDKKPYAVGRYDENRVNLYASDLFHNTSNDIDGYNGARTLHIGIDLDGPVGTKVHAFTDGSVHSAGFNKELGDYGNVIVVEHDLVGHPKQEGNSRKIWALYGHLDAKSIVGKTKGKRVKKGQVLGRMGDIHENGGWLTSHVHFQLSIHAPETHDMPGAVAMEDRAQALVDYPDPRLVLGPLY